MLNVVSLFIGLVALVLTVVAFTPLLGWANWAIIPAAGVGAGATGLGLFLAEGLVAAMGGRIWVDSDEGRGSTFVLELRAAETET